MNMVDILLEFITNHMIKKERQAEMMKGIEEDIIKQWDRIKEIVSESVNED